MSWDAVRDRVERICARSVSDKQLRVAVLAVVHDVLPFDGHVWLLSDPVTRVGTSPLADVPGVPLPDLPDLIRQRYLVGDAWTGFRPPGTADVLTAIHRDNYGYWGWLDLWRSAAEFSSGERDFLSSLQAPVTAALRRTQARTFAASEAVGSLPGAAVIVLDPNLRPKGKTSAAVRALIRLNPPQGGVPLVPAAAYNVAAALLAAEAGRWTGPTWSRAHLDAGRWVTLSAARIDDGGDIAVTIEASTPGQRRELFALAHALSPRERQVLDELATGADTPAIARRLVLSEHTVNDHVKAILAKTGRTTRPHLLASIAS